MKKFLWWTLLMTNVLSWSGVGGHSEEDFLLGEYYEFDVEGSKSDQVKRKIRKRAKRGMLAPFKAVRWTFHITKSGAKKIFRTVELTFGHRDGDTKTQYGFMADLDDDGDMLFANYYSSEGDHHHCLGGVPHGVWKSLKAALNTVGHCLPRGTVHSFKHIAQNSLEH